MILNNSTNLNKLQQAIQHNYNYNPNQINKLLFTNSLTHLVTDSYYQINRMLSKAILTKILQLEYISCSKRGHQGQDLSILCMNIECEGDRVLCCYCDEQKHQGHQTVMLKDYLMDVYLTKIQNQTQQLHPYSPTLHNTSFQTNHSHIPQTNYLSFISNIQTYKLSALKSLQIIRQRFLDQLTDIQANITSSAHHYMQKIKSISEVNFGRVDLVQRLQSVWVEKNVAEMNALIGRYVNDYNVFDGQKRMLQEVSKPIESNQRPYQFSTNYETHQQLVTIQNAFKNKIKSLEHALKSFDFQFIPKLSKFATFQNIKFKQFSALYDWDLNMKSKNFEIDQNNNKIIRGIKNSVGCERFAFMKKTFPSESKEKFKWAIKINNLAGWISVGIGFRKVISNVQFKFNYSSTGHGSYMISDNGYSWSHSSVDNNSKKQSFNFLAGDVIVIEFDAGKKEVKFKKLLLNKGPEQSFTMSIAEYTQSDKLSPCVNMCSPKDEVQIVAVPSS